MLFVLDRHRGGSGDNLHKTIKLAGITDNVYNVIITNQPQCDFPPGERVTSANTGSMYAFLSNFYFI